MSDIFEDMKDKIGCEYISDLPCYKKEIENELKQQDLSKYDKKQIDDFFEYIFVNSD